MTSILEDTKLKIQIEQTVRGFLRELDENKLDLEDGLFGRNMLGFNRFPRYISRRKLCCNSRIRGRFEQRFFDPGQLF